MATTRQTHSSFFLAFSLLFLLFLSLGCAQSATKKPSSIDELPSAQNHSSLVVPSTLVYESSDNNAVFTPTPSHLSAKVGLEKGNIAPDVIISTLEGNARRVQGFSESGSPLLLYFFATWCPYCTNDFTTLSAIYPSYAQEVPIIAIDIDSGETEQKILSYKARFPKLESIEFSKTNQDALSSYGIRFTTTKYAIGRDGTILYAGSGELSEAQWVTLLDALKNS